MTTTRKHPQTIVDMAAATYEMIYEKNVEIPSGDSFVSVNIFRPALEAKVPALLGVSPYGKDLHTKDGFPEIWEEMQAHLSPHFNKDSTLSLHTWETNDPEIWVPWGYACVRMDTPGSGKSPGVIDCYSPVEAKATYDAIEWCAAQDWCNGKVALIGISYLAIIQWRVATEQPPHLTCICPWEGEFDYYREWARHGGILSNTFTALWYPTQVLALQNGFAGAKYHDLDDADAPIGGPESLSEEDLRANRVDILQAYRDREMDDQWYRDRSGAYEKITVPLLSAANWGGQGLHGRGNVEGFTQSASAEKWMEVHGGNHRDAFYLPNGESLQKEFFDHYLRGVENGWRDRAPVLLRIRHIDDTFVDREEQEWPLARTQWTKQHLDVHAGTLGDAVPAAEGSASYQGMGTGLRLRTAPLAAETEITGPLAAKLFVSSSTEDMDIFATLRVLDPYGDEVTFAASAEPRAPLAQGWLRVSHRKLDAERSTPYRPWHSHDEKQPLTPGELYEVDVEIWPTCLVVPVDHTLELLIEGKDFARDASERDETYGAMAARMSSFAGQEWDDLFLGGGLFLHNDPQDRPEAIFNGSNTIYSGPKHPSYLLLPVVPNP